ncbi:hypothetical protein N656DRAFT_759535 [Canariomyces notabilis]|uniref:NIMA interactive protein n=1 Tax=Canariomyces notabilis TaxID=2074819 RepID=A0AAN6QFS4_9PEZI|nr:hypothetical protein N656DRAFT_759535 [Canariomyces arenarius]
MIESENLRTASLYINNQLLSRGLLRDGNSIDFTHPGDSDAEVAETMSRIIGVVNDLILRRDRDAEHRESLSATLRALRAESLRQTNDIQRLQEKHAEAQRKVGLSEAAEAALRTHLKTAEATIHRLKEEAARTKTLVAQTRAACANEVRKRDRQIEGLKKAVTEAGRARGASKNPGITTITVVGDVGSDTGPGLPTGGTANEGYDLRMETNSFLAELAKGLSEENEALLHLVRRTMEQLKEMSGWDAGIGATAENGYGHALALPSSCAEISNEVDAVLEHLRTILTNPSFVPIEEVVVREDEIHRLRDGWEKMETRWKEAVHLIDGWRKRMQASGRPVNVEELKMGLRLSPVKVHNVEETSQGYRLCLAAVPEDAEEAEFEQAPSQEEPLNLVPEHDIEDGEESDASSIFQDHVNVDDLDVEEPNVQILQQSVMLSSPPLPPAPQISPLRDSYTAGNRGGRSDNRRRQRGYPAIAEEDAFDLAPEEASLPPPNAPEKPQQPPQKKPVLSLRTVPPEEAAEIPLPQSAVVSTPDTSIDSVSLVKPTEEPPPKASATSTRSQKRPSPVTRKKSHEESKVSSKLPSKPPSKSRPAGPTHTRGRSQTRRDERDTQQQQQAAAKPPPLTRSAASTSTTCSAKSAASTTTSTKSAGSNSSSSKNTDATTTTTSTTMGPPPAPSPSRSPWRVNSRLPLPRNGNGGNGNGNSIGNGNCPLPPPQQSPLTMATIAAKLAASEREADAARVRAKLKAAAARRNNNNNNSNKGVSASVSVNGVSSGVGVMTAASTTTTITAADSARADDHDSEGGGMAGTARSEGAPAVGLGTNLFMDMSVQQQQQQQEEVVGGEVGSKKQRGAGVRRRDRDPADAARSSKTAARRRSTLNSWELSALIQGGNVTVGR